MEGQTVHLKQTKQNISSSLLAQAVTIVCGIIVPQLIISTYGSEAYGATTSIAQFLGYISLLEGGVCGVARAALYKPLFSHDTKGISAVISQISDFFKRITYISIVYVIILACFYRAIAKTDLEWSFTFFLVIAVSVSTIAQNLIGISYSILLQADQKSYIANVCSIITVALNTAATVILVNIGVSLLVVKFVSGCIFIIRPIIMYAYVKRRYVLIKISESKKEALKDKWTAFGQHLAFYFHSNTDVVLLTILVDLKAVAVYAVYYMIVYSIQSFASSFANGLEALFGNLIASGEHDRLKRIFSYYDTLISTVSVILFSITAVLIVPFISVYTRAINDTNYIEPIFAIILILCGMTNCLRIPYHQITIAAGHFKQTRTAAYGEAAINILLSVILISSYGLIGVVSGTIVAISFRFIFYITYLSENILQRSVWVAVKREFINYCLFFICYFAGTFICSRLAINGYLSWLFATSLVVPVLSLVVFTCNYVFYKTDYVTILNKILKKARGNQL